jgi:hypothetical protein
MFAKGEIGIVGGVYNVENGQVDFFKNLTKNGKGNEAKRYASVAVEQ